MGYMSSVADALLNGMGTNLFGKSANLISGIAPLFSAGFGIYVLLVMISYYKGGLDENIIDFSKKMLGWLVIIACAFNAGTYNKLANLMYGMPEAISAMFGSGEYSMGALDANFENLERKIVETCEHANSLPITEIGERVGIYLLAIFIFVFGSVYFAVTAAFYLVAKLSLAMVILIGPLFLGCLLFPATRQWGMNWIGQILNYTVTIIFYVILGSLQNDFFSNHISTVLSGGISSMIMLIPIACIFATSTLIFLIVAWNIPSIASGLTGGASMGGMPRALVSVARHMKSVSLGGGKTKGGSISKN